MLEQKLSCTEQIAIGGSKSNTKSSRVQFPTPYVLPPEVTARVEGEASYNDRYNIVLICNQLKTKPKL